MKKVAVLTAGLALLAIAGSSSASVVGDLTVYAWVTQGGTANVSANANVSSNTYGIGSFTGTFIPTAGTAVNAGKLFCVDIFHSFQSGNDFSVTRFEIPAESGGFPPPPWNSNHAAWLYQTYAASATTAAKAGGLQLALWEVTHQSDWYSGFNAATWQSTGLFRVNSTGSLQLAQASSYLSSMEANLNTTTGVITDGSEFSAYYYRDNNHGEGDPDYGQGQIGDVPEPGSMMILGLGLLAFAGGTWRRRAARRSQV